MKLDAAYSLILPTPSQTLLLQSAVLPRDRAAAAFAEWQAVQPDPREALVGKPYGGRLLAPLILDNLRGTSVEFDTDMLTYLRTAAMREELRSNEVTKLLRAALRSLEGSGVEALALRGTALPFTAYPSVRLRHTHDLDFLVTPADLDRSVSIVESIGFTNDSRGGFRSQPLFRSARPAFRGVHPSGMPLQLHVTPFTVPHYYGLLEDPWKQAREFEVGGVKGRVMDPIDQLVHVCVHASTGWHRHKLLWVTDAFFTMSRSTDLDWERLLRAASRSGAAIPLNVTLNYLRRELDAPVPAEVLDRLKGLAFGADRLSREVALFGAWTGPGPKLPRLLSNMEASRERAFLIRWRFLPTARSLVAAGRVGSSSEWLPWLLGRPFRYLRNRTGRMLQTELNPAAVSGGRTT